mmetsp:Transcript_19343/g.30382  ORF Transcript_19343/g.30382 Transcript_19343/m.30382 type:complete len:88 (+) Transcript_19343:1645-1908(+)
MGRASSFHRRYSTLSTKASAIDDGEEEEEEKKNAGGHVVTPPLRKQQQLRRKQIFGRIRHRRWGVLHGVILLLFRPHPREMTAREKE